MDPLSPALYFRRNLLRTLPVLGIIALAVVGVLVVGVLAESQLASPRRDYLEPAKLYAQVHPRRGNLDPNIAARLRSHPDVERVIRILPASTRVTGLMGSQSRTVRGLPEADLEWYMSSIGMSVVEGQLPQGSRKEIALHTNILKAKKLQVGDQLGNDLDPDESIPGKFTIVGRLEGPVEIGLATAPALREFTRRAEVLQVFAKPGRMEALDAYLITLRSVDVDVTTVTTATESLERETQFVAPILLSINGVTVFVLSLAVGLLNQIYFLQRIPEYGILLALGYRVSFLVRRTMIEAMSLTVAGWVLGLGVAFGTSAVLKRLIFDPNGMTLAPLSWQIVATTLPVPVLIGVFSLTTVIRRLMTLDSVSIVERRD